MEQFANYVTEEFVCAQPNYYWFANFSEIMLNEEKLVIFPERNQNRTFKNGK